MLGACEALLFPRALHRAWRPEQARDQLPGRGPVGAGGKPSRCNVAVAALSSAVALGLEFVVELGAILGEDSLKK